MHFVIVSTGGKISDSISNALILCPLTQKSCSKDCMWFSVEYSPKEHEYDRVLCKGVHVANLDWRKQDAKEYKYRL